MAHQHPTNNPIKHRLTGLDYVEVGKWKTVFKEKFNLAYFYQALHEYLVEEGIGERDENKFGEVYYMQRENPNFGKEARIRWRCEWQPPGTPGKDYHGLFYYTMDFDWYFLGVKNTEGTFRGQKVEIQKGELELISSAKLIIDKKGYLEKSALKPFKKFMLYRLLKKQLDMHKKNVYDAHYKTRDWVHNYFKMPLSTQERDEFVARRTLE